MRTLAAIRSPAAKVEGLVYFGRMLDKIRAHGRGELAPEYQANLGKGFDGACVRFLQVSYGALADRVKQGGTDEEILQWCFDHGTHPSDDEIFIWNEFMRKRGWKDDVTPTLEWRKNEAGLGERSDIQTMFAFIDADEGRDIP